MSLFFGHDRRPLGVSMSVRADEGRPATQLLPLQHTSSQAIFRRLEGSSTARSRER